MTPAIRPLKVVTGASRGIGAAIARAIAEPNAEVVLVGRDRTGLHSVARVVDSTGAKASVEVVDLLDRERVERWTQALAASHERLDLLVHSAGTFTRGPLADADPREIADLMEVHAGAPLLITRTLLPLLARAEGTVLFINSTAVLRPGAELGAYTAAKAAQRSLADSLRAEMGNRGVRVLSAFVGRTATPMQERVHALEGRDYRPELLLPPGDLAHTLVRLLDGPADIAEVTIRGPRPRRDPNS